MRFFAGSLAAMAALVMLAPRPAAQTRVADPLAVARILAAKYPAQPIMSYIPALAWSGNLHLSALTREPQWREKALKDIQAFTSGQTPAIAEPYRLTSLAGALAFADASTLAGDAQAGALAQKVAQHVLPQAETEVIRFATGWTDDMFMAASANASAPARLVRRYGSAIAGACPDVNAWMSFIAFSRQCGSRVSGERCRLPDHARAGM